MSIFANVSNPPAPKTKNSKTIAIYLAGIFVVFAVAQLFGFENFLEILSSEEVFGGEVGSKLFAVLIVVFEVFSLPFLLRMKVSRLMRFSSMICGWLATAIWLYVCIRFLPSGSSDIGLLGGIVELTPGWWSVFMILGLGIMSAWASWGMWPGLKKLSFKK